MSSGISGFSGFALATGAALALGGGAGLAVGFVTGFATGCGGGAVCASPDTAIAQGDSREYYGSREYQQGVPVRRWDYSAWARFAKPYVREYEDRLQANAAVLVDLSIDTSSRQRSGWQRADRLDDIQEDGEAAISVAAAVVEMLLARGWRIQLFAVDDRPPWIQWDPPQDARLQLMRRLALVKPDSRSSATSPSWLETLRNSQLSLEGLTAVVILCEWGDRQQEQYAELLGHVRDVEIYLPAESFGAAPSFVRRPPPQPAAVERTVSEVLAAEITVESAEERGAS